MGFVYTLSNGSLLVVDGDKRRIVPVPTFTGQPAEEVDSVLSNVCADVLPPVGSPEADVILLLEQIIRRRGPELVIHALRDACHALADHVRDNRAGRSHAAEAYQRAGDAFGFAADDVRKAQNEVDMTLADGLAVLGD